MLTSPPPLTEVDSARPIPDRAAALAVGAGSLLAVTAARLVSAGQLPGVHCQWLRWTHLPCPGCGATRCLAACGRLDFAGALGWNPLVALTLLGLLAWAALTALGNAPARRLAHQLPRRINRRTVLGAMAVNWLYLCWALPR